MAVNSEFVKKHWAVITGGIVGLFVLYYIIKHASTPADATSTDISGGGQQVQALSAAASLQNAQTNAQVETSQLSSMVAAHQIDAQLQATALTTAAQLAATQQKISADRDVSLADAAATVQVQKLISDQAVAQTQIQGTVLQNLAVTAGKNKVALQAEQNKVALQMIQNSNAQVMYGVTHDTGHLKSYLEALAPVIAAETGQGGAAVGLANANTAKDIGTSVGTQVSQVAGGIDSVLSGLFG